MKVTLITVSSVLVICALFATAVDGQATARDVQILQRKVNSLKKIIVQINKQLKVASSQYDKFKTVVGNAEGDIDNLYAKAQNYCNGKVRVTKRFINNQTSLLKGMLVKRVTNSYSSLKAGYDKSVNTYKDFTKTLTDQHNSQKVIKVENSQVMEESEGKIESIKNGLVEQSVEDVGSRLYLTNRQLQQKQFSDFEKTRSDGYSGLKQIKSNGVGGKNYFSADHKDWSVAGITDHSEKRDVLGIGEFSAALNGIDFISDQRTYKMEQPSYNGEYDDKKPVIFPDVPLEVSQLTSIDQQIIEMRNWFKDFQNGEHGERNINGHFKPFLSYIEGAFTNDMQDEQQLELNQYLTGTGSPFSTEYGPSTVFGFNEKLFPEYSTWKSRIVTHPINRQDLTPSKFRMNPDIVSQIRYYNSYHNLKDSPAADFDLQYMTGNGYENNKPMYYTYLDVIMEEVVGKENSNVKVTAQAMDGIVVTSANPYVDDPLKDFNEGYYHRAYKLQQTDAMGISNGQRSFSDRLYVAVTNQPKVSGPKLVEGEATLHVRSSYAMPLEVIFLTPLTKWNPYDVLYKEDCGDVKGAGTATDPYDAACSERFYFTPQAFFSDAAECGKLPGENAAFFLAGNGDSVCLVGSGIRTVLPMIEGQNERIRQRYPIVPVFKDGNSAAKKLNAIEDGLSLSTDNLISKISISTGASCRDGVPKHKHYIRLSIKQFQELEKKKILKNIKTLEDDNGHQHIFTLTKESDGSFKATECDSENPDPSLDKVCWDQHNPLFQIIAEPLKPGSGYGYGYGYAAGYAHGY